MMNDKELEFFRAALSAYLRAEEKLKEDDLNNALHELNFIGGLRFATKLFLGEDSYLHKFADILWKMLFEKM